MLKKDKVNFVIKTLKDFYPKIPIPLDHKDPYTLLIAVLLSAQCTDVRVNKITPILFAKADNPYDMAKLTVEQIKEIIRPCGLSPMKSKGIYGLSKIIIESQELRNYNRIESNKKIYKILNQEIKDSIHSLQILIN